MRRKAHVRSLNGQIIKLMKGEDTKATSSRTIAIESTNQKQMKGEDKKVTSPEKIATELTNHKTNQMEDCFMKFKSLLTWCILLAVIFFTSATQIFAQNEMEVQWDDGAGNVVQDALYNAVMGDTIAGGARANLDRIYVLKSGGYYWNNKTINSNFPLRLVGETPDATHQPAVVQMVLDVATSAAPGKMISCSNRLTLKNLYIIGSDELGSSGYYQPIEVNAVAKRFIIDNCVFERSNFAIVAFAGGKDNDLFITNCVYRNLQEREPTQQWTGRGLSVWTDADTIVIENNTFFNINMCAIQIENGAANYLRFNHNTLVNIGRALSSTTNVWWREAYFANLLLVNVWWHGEGECDYGTAFAPGRDPRAYTTGIFPVVDMPSRYGTNKGRRILFSNTAAYLDPYFETNYGDTIRVQHYTNAITDSFFNTYGPLNGGQMLIQDTSWLSIKPTFTVDPNTPAQLEAMWNHITASRGYQYYGTGVQAKPYYYALQIEPGTGDTLWYMPSWPLPENFSYTDANIKTGLSTDGLPLGDLRWFPTEKATFEANKDAYIKAIEWMPGGKIVEVPVWQDQAEAGALGGNAVVEPFTGEAWYTLTGGTNIEWTFNSTYAGPFDMKMKARADGSNIGFDFLVNGDHIVDRARGWGQFVVWTGADDPQTFWTGKSTSEFYEASYAFADMKNNDNAANDAFVEVVSGANTLKLQYSWNNISFQWVEFYEAGTTNLIAKLVPATAVNNGATPGGVGTWVPMGFNSVDLKTGGSITFADITLAAGRYKARLYYQNPGAAQTGTVKVDGTEMTTFTFASQPDETGIDVISDLFDVAAGTHSLTISGSGAKVDWLMLINEYTVTGVKETPVLPDGFALSQNYPNPFNPSTTINFKVGKLSNVELTVYNILGQKVATLVNQKMDAGYYKVNWDASLMPSGMYFYTMKVDNYAKTCKMIMLK